MNSFTIHFDFIKEIESSQKAIIHNWCIIDFLLSLYLFLDDKQLVFREWYLTKIFRDLLNSMIPIVDLQFVYFGE